MLSKYFIFKTQSKEFEKYIECLINEIKHKKVLIYGAGEGFLALNAKYSLTSVLNIAGISDKKFENSTCEIFEGMKTISPDKIPKEDYEIILVSNERTKEIVNFLQNTLKVEEAKIKVIFKDEMPDEYINFNYLNEQKFEKTLPKVIKKLKNKTVVLYGAGAFIELIKKYFDISEINVIGIADKRFTNHDKNEEFLGYKAYSPNEITEIKPDYVLVATKFYINILEELYCKTLKNARIKIIPLVRKSLWTLMKEIWK